jgi:hypothetical protein
MNNLFCSNQSTHPTLTKPRSGTIFTVAGDTTATPANFKAGFCTTDIHPFNTSIIPDETFVPSLVTYSDDAQVHVTLTESPGPVLLSQKKQKNSPVHGTPGKFGPTKPNADVLSTSKEADADPETNSITAPSQETP